MPVYITNPDCFPRIAQIEGSGWAEREVEQQKRGAVRESFFSVRKEYMEAVQQCPEDPTSLMANNVIYGESGYARYIVKNDGEVVLDGSSVRKEKADLAEAAGFKVTVTK